MTEERVWLGSYPEGVPADIDASQYESLLGLMADSFAKYAKRTAYSFMGQDISYQETDVKSQALAAYLQSLGLEKGDRVAIMMPNVPQYPVAVAAILRAGLVVVNVNPLYTPRELEHQLKDSGAKAIVIIENFAITLQKCIAETQIKHVVLCAMGDMLSMPKGALVNFVVRNVKSLVPDFDLPGAVKFNQALSRGERAPFVKPVVKSEDIAVLQYTGGTTGVSKGAMLLHRNVIANLLQSEAWNDPVMKRVPANEQPHFGVRFAAVSHLCFYGQHDAGHAHGRQKYFDSQSARFARCLERVVNTHFSQFPCSQYLVQWLGQSPRL